MTFDHILLFSIKCNLPIRWVTYIVWYVNETSLVVLLCPVVLSLLLAMYDVLVALFSRIS